VDGLIYCCPQIPEENFDIIPGPNGYVFVAGDAGFASDKQNAIIYAINHPRFAGKKPTLAYIE
jgi:hypothetical protein